MSNFPLILAIDTSCDDTAAAVTLGSEVWSNVIASQTQLHKPYGGVFPTVAKQAHRENIDRVVALALKRAGVTAAAIEVVAVTQGPGLAPALEVGIAKAEQLAAQWQVPLVAVNHVEAHAWSPVAVARSRRGVTAVVRKKSMHIVSTKLAEPDFPVLSLVISGGHSEFILITGVGQYQRLGWKIDDAAGEALDKVGRMLDLGYPAGATIEQFAKKGDPKRWSFPLPMTEHQDYRLSFSGLKTAARNLLKEIEDERPLSQQDIYDFAASIQYAVFRHICAKLSKILVTHNVGDVWLGGGVAANIELRRMIRETLRVMERGDKHPKLKLRTPYSKKLCMDNAAMIGVLAGWRWQAGLRTNDVKQIERKPRWAVGED